MKEKIDFDSIVTRAYETLILQDKLEYPIDVFKLKTNFKVKIISIDELSKESNRSYNDILYSCDGADAFKFEKFGYFFIVYKNRDTIISRIRWSIAHEYAHIILGHKTQSDINEVEANFFAANLLLPRCILKELIKRKDNFSKEYIKNKFGMSQEATDKFFSNINSRGFNYFTNEYDDIIIEKSKKFLERESRNSKKYMYEYEDQLQKERDSWLYE